jgi:hypothetical protein
MRSGTGTNSRRKLGRRHAATDSERGGIHGTPGLEDGSTRAAGGPAGKK